MADDPHTETRASLSPSAGALRLSTPDTAPDPSVASKLASSLRLHPGHVVVTGPTVASAARLFALAESQLGAARVVRIPARLLVEAEVARAVVGVVARGLAAPSPAEVAAAADATREANRSIVILVDDGDAVSLDRLERVRMALERTPAMREVVRIALLGGSALLRLVESPDAKAFMSRVSLHLNVVAPAPPKLDVPVAAARPARRARVRRESRWLTREQLLVLAVGAVLVAGVLLLPAEEPDAVRAVPPPVAAPASDVVEVGPAPEAEVLAPAPEALAVPVPAEAPAPAESAPAQEVATPSVPIRPAIGPAFQVGAFRDRENALDFAGRLRRDFDGVFIDAVGTDVAPLYRVRIEIPEARGAERALAQALRERDLPVMRVP